MNEFLRRIFIVFFALLIVGLALASNLWGFSITEGQSEWFRGLITVVLMVGAIAFVILLFNPIKKT